MTGYGIAAISTEYRGRRYRSRLEAKWAAFFDHLGWQHEYEPFDLGPWSPDFLIQSPVGFRLFVEIKPIEEFSDEVAEKMARGARADTDASCDGLLLLGTSPFRTGSLVQLGWGVLTIIPRERLDWRRFMLGWSAQRGTPGLRPDGYLEYDTIDGGFGYTGLMVEDEPGPRAHSVHPYQDHAIETWARATNLVQWRGPRK